MSNLPRLPIRWAMEFSVFEMLYALEAKTWSAPWCLWYHGLA